jgi:TonB family protein
MATCRPAGLTGMLAALALICGLPRALAVDGPPDLTASERAAVRAYYDQMQKAAPSDTIVDLEDPALQGRIQRPERRQMKQPEISADLRHQHAHGRVIIGALTERDGSTTHAKIIVPSEYPAFDEVALRAVSEARYDGPAKLDGKAVRAFFYAVIDFNVK